MTAKLKNHKQKIMLAVIAMAMLAIAVSIGACGRSDKEDSEMVMTALETAQIEKRTLMESISATGKVTSVADEEVKADVNGVKVMQLYVRVGDEVKAGDILCELDASDIEEDLKDTRITLNAAQGKTGIDLSASERSLHEAQTTRNIEVERSNQDAADAWNDYQKALSELKEAENDYNNAKTATAGKNGEYERCKKLMDKAKSDMNDAGSSSQIQTQFNAMVNELRGYLDGCNIIPKDGALENLTIQNGNLQNYTSNDIISKSSGGHSYSADMESGASESDDSESDASESADSDAQADEVTDSEPSETSESQDALSLESDEEPEPEDSEETESLSLYAEESALDTSAVTTEVDARLSQLKELQRQYQAAAASEADYQSLQTEAAEWEQKYNTAKSEEKSYETAYKQAITTADSKLDAYNQKVRSKEDTVRSNDSTVSTREDSLKTSRLNASTTGLSDKQQIKSYEEQIEACTVKASMDGVITQLNVDVGDTYSSSVSIARIENTAAYEITSEIDEYDIGKVKIGQDVVIKTNGTGDTQMHGKVKEIAPRATTGSSDVTYTVTISMEEAPEELKLDMTAKLSIIIESKENVLAVPYAAVIEDENGNCYIEVDNSNARQDENVTGNTERIAVTKGIESDYYVEVSGESIQEGMTVLVQSSTEDSSDIQDRMERMGPMGGF